MSRESELQEQVFQLTDRLAREIVEHKECESRVRAETGNTIVALSSELDQVKEALFAAHERIATLECMLAPATEPPPVEDSPDATDPVF